MRISELSATTHVPVPTLKYYLREGLLHAGVATSRTQARYDDSHADRVRLIRALLESGGLTLNRVRQVLETLDDPDAPRHDLLGVAQRAITPPLPDNPDPEWTCVATQFTTEQGWTIEPDDPMLVLLGEQLRLVLAAGVEGAEADLLQRYADIAKRLAQVDVDSLPDTPSRVLRQVTVGTVLTDPLILTLRRLAQQALSHTES